MSLVLLTLLASCSEYEIANEPGTNELTGLDGLSEADGEVDWDANADLDLPGADISLDDEPGDEAGDDLHIPGVDIRIDHDPEETEIPDIPGIDIDEQNDPEEPTEEFGPDGCDGGLFVDFQPGEIAVLSWDTAPALGEITVPADGVYEIWNTSIAESGPSQRNESGYVLIPNALNPTGEPLFPNCDGVRILEDPDNNGPVPAGTSRYIGTFPLVAGVNSFELRHYCPLARNGQCLQFHDTVEASSTCDSGDVNSVHFFPEQFCLYPL